MYFFLAEPNISSFRKTLWGGPSTAVLKLTRFPFLLVMNPTYFLFLSPFFYWIALDYLILDRWSCRLKFFIPHVHDILPWVPEGYFLSRGSLFSQLRLLHCLLLPKLVEVKPVNVANVSQPCEKSLPLRGKSKEDSTNLWENRKLCFLPSNSIVFIHIRGA